LLALEILKNEPERVKHSGNLPGMRLRIQKTGIDTGLSHTPIIPLYIRDNIKTLTLTKMLLDEGVFINPVVSPAVSKDNTLIRFSLMQPILKNRSTQPLKNLNG